MSYHSAMQRIPLV